MALQKYVPSGEAPSVSVKRLSFCSKVHEKAQLADLKTNSTGEPDVDIDLREVYFLIMHFLSAGPCHRTYGQFWNELLEHQLLPRRYHAWYSRNGVQSGDENDDGSSFPLSYNKLVERYPHIEKDHLVKLLKQLILNAASPTHVIGGGNAPNASDVPTLLGTGSFSLLDYDRSKGYNKVKGPRVYMRWPHMQADQVRGLTLREIGGGFSRHHRGPSIRAASYAIAKPSTMVQKMQNIKRLRGHRNAVYCAVFDRSGRHVITGSDDRLVKIWSMETAYCLASCRGHEGDITDLAVSSNNALVASSSNDCIIRVWRLADGLPISVLRGHTGAVTAIAFSPRPGSTYQLLSSSDDGTCRIWDATKSQISPRVYIPRPPDSVAVAGRNNAPSSSTGPQTCQIFCCAFNANGTVFVTGSSDNLARVWHASRFNTEESEQPNHELDVLSGHENDVNYVQFSGCAVGSKFSIADTSKEENLPKFKNSWFTHDNIVTCSRDGSAIIWVPRTRRSHGKVGRWTRAYHLKVPPPPMPPQPPRGGPRQRILPTPRGVNMITWSLDNRFVLAAIMDCRICVWNAADGSLVHSLTGHSESTYVLDVHPFNPRIAMSAGYDGKTIVWDIWEGTPIRIYEIAPFKLVDGKFSPDGTSIILSDDVGQLYILNTGQGESQMDAKYDQFFLGDYRPLIQDTHGNFLDQETQLPPYVRNIQDLLCDSGMMPYPEPYQSMYQQRRLGALGIEWHPSSVRFAVGTDITLDQEYQMLPLVDLDILTDPLQEFTHTMDWEPEIEVQSDDTADSEYNVPEEYYSGGEQASLSFNSSGDPESSDEDSDVENAHKDGLRRSKRKKTKVDTEFMTSSGRRVKRRNLDECDGNSFRNHQTKKSSCQKVRRRKSSILKSLRPQRAAARNAITMFSQITGTSTDGSEDESSGRDSTLKDSNIESDESDESLQNKQSKHVKGKEVSMDESEEVVIPHELPEFHTSDVNRRRLVLKLPLYDSNKLVPSESPMNKCDNREDFVGSSSKAFEEASEVNCSGIVKGERVLSEKVENHLDLSEGYKDVKIRWGGVKARTSKRMRLGEAMPSDAYAGSSICNNQHDESENYVDGCIKPETEHVMISPHGLSAAAVGTTAKKSGVNECGDYNELPKLGHMVVDNTAASSIRYNNVTDHSPELNGTCAPISKKLRMRLKTTTKDPENPSKLKITTSGEGWRNGSCETLSESPSNIDQNLISEGRECDCTNRTSSDHGDDVLQNVEAQIENNTGRVLKDSQELHSYSKKKMYDAVYKRSKTHRVKINSEADTCGMEESTSTSCEVNINAGVDVAESSINGSHRTRSMGLNSTTNCPNLRVVGLRSARNRRGNSNLADSSPADRRRNQSARKQSWLMLSTHEGSRYIPQSGDEVAYLRQGHQEYIEFSCSKEIGPWVSLKNKIRDVEFCKVVGLAYDYVPGSGESCCKMTIQFVDHISSVFGETFKLSLPEIIGFPDFLVERTRFDAAINRNWTSRDKCQVWWENEDEDGAWWEGRILSVKPKSPEFPDSPWERYVIQYKSDPTETHSHSPWELYNADTQWEQPHIDDVIREKLLSSFAKLDRSGNRMQDQYGVNKLKQVSDKTTFRNRSPVPLSLEVIHLRLENNYYRSLEALKHDIAVMLSIAVSYFEKNAEMSPKMRRLSEWFTETLSSL